MKIRKYIKPMIYFYIGLISYLLVITILSYFNLISYKTLSIISFIFIIILFMSLGFMSAYKTEKKGYIAGLLSSLFNVLLFLFLSLIFAAFPKWNVLIYYLVLILSGTVGGMFGINIKNKRA